MPLRGPFSFAVAEEHQTAAGVLAAALEPWGKIQWGDQIKRDSGILFNMRHSEELEPQAYRISISEGGVNLSAGSEGLYHGISTLRQLLLQPLETEKGPALPCLEIADQPRYPWRGVLLDSSRHYFRKSTVLRFIDHLALFKFNRFHWHLTDDQGWRLESKTFPLLTEVGAWRGPPHARYGGFYTQEEVREVVAYAHARGIAVVPEIDIPGHATAMIAAYPHLGCSGKPVDVETGWGIKEQNLDPGKEETFDFLEQLFAEVAGLFPIHGFTSGPMSA